MIWISWYVRVLFTENIGSTGFAPTIISQREEKNKRVRDIFKKGGEIIKGRKTNLPPYFGCG
jgi:hypothetical protein